MKLKHINILNYLLINTSYWYGVMYFAILVDECSAEHIISEPNK